MPFRYSGSKKRMLKHLPAPPAGTEIVVEPFAGSAAYGLHHQPGILVLAEKNTDVRELWRWLLEEATAERLLEIEKLKPEVKTDIRDIPGLAPAEVTLMRLMISGAYVGQLSSWRTDPKNSLNLSKVVEALPYIQDSLGAIRNEHLATLQYDAFDDTMFFIDPDYLGTKANYVDKSGKAKLQTSAADIMSFIRQIKSPILFTYGSDAPEVFPDLPWEVAVVRKVPILRGGGTKLRTEHFCKLNWK